MENILVSACLLGVHCRYDGKCQDIPEFSMKLPKFMEKYNLIPVCPEIMGGLSTPRTPSEIVRGNCAECGSGEGEEAPDKVVSKEGTDVTKQFERGGCEAVHLASLYDCRYAVLKARSPSCGSGQIYDGTFSKTLTKGDGIAAGMLKKQGVRIFNENNFDELL